MAPKRVGRPPSHSGRRAPSASTFARAAAFAPALAEAERRLAALSNEIEQLKYQNEELRSLASDLLHRAEAAEAQLQALGAEVPRELGLGLLASD